MTQPFKYGANYGGDNTDAFSRGALRGTQIAGMRQENVLRQRKMEEEDSNKNALNTMALMEQPEYQEAMKDPSNRNTLMADQGVTPVQQQAIQEQRIQKRKAELSPFALAAAIAGPEEKPAIKQTIYNMLTDQEKAQFGKPESWNDGHLFQFATGADLKQTLDYLKKENVAVIGATSRENVADKRKADKADTTTQKERERDEFVAEYKDQYPGLKRVHIAQAEKLVQKEGMPFAEALAEVMAGVKEREYPSGLKTSGGGAQYPTWAFGGGGGSAKGGAATSGGEKPPSGAKDTGRTSGGKKVWQLPNGKYWVPSR